MPVSAAVVTGDSASNISAVRSRSIRPRGRESGSFTLTSGVLNRDPIRGGSCAAAWIERTRHDG